MFRRVHGEAVSVNQEAIANAMPRISRIISNYACRDVWNADEFGLFHHQPPSWTLISGQITRFTKDESRIKVLTCCNNDGSERIPFMAMGTALRPRPFSGKTGAKLGFGYRANEREWMMKELFFGWLERPDSYIRRTVGRQIFLLVDNCFARGKEEKFPPLQNVCVEFLPPTTTRKMQPLDAGMIVWVKAKYKCRLLFWVFENLDVGKKPIYNVDILTAFRWTYEAWNSCPADSIRNCFNHRLKQTGSTNIDTEAGVNAEALQAMERDATEQGVTFTKAGIDNLLKPADEKEVVETATREEVAREVAGIEPAVASNAVAEEQDDGEEIYSVLQQLKCLVIVEATLQRFGSLEHVCVKALMQCQHDFRLQVHRSLKKTTIEEYFGKK